MPPTWFRNAVIYQIDVALFRDSDGDGWGDLNGVTERLDHVRALGADTIWLLPFYRSPYRDGGYDVTDHLAVDPRVGDLADFAMLLDRADALGLRVLVDLVAQHTSIDHPWFQAACRDRSSPYRDYYVWADEPHETGVEPAFPDVEDSVWSWHDGAQQYYRHTFYDHEPDLDLGNPRVRREVERVMAFWLRLGVSGFRVDAVPYMVERAAAHDPTDGGLWLLEEMREVVALRRPESILLGEVDVHADQHDDYLGDGNRLTMLLNFWVNNHLFLALARHQAEPVTRALTELPGVMHAGQHANFTRNHDELNLALLEESERQEVLDAFAPDPSMRVFDRGIRRRLAPMLGGDARRVAMAQALMMSLPGSPVLLYGDEIGMGDDLSRTGRKAVRTPMQWSGAANGGFSTAPADTLVAPVIAGPQFGARAINVQEQMRRPDSLMSQVGALARARLGFPEFGSGEYDVLDVGCPSVVGLCHRSEGRHVVTMVNLSPEAVTCELTGSDDLGDLVDVLADREYPQPETDPIKLQLEGYGYRWLRQEEMI